MMFWRVSTMAAFCATAAYLGTTLADRTSPLHVEKVEVMTPAVPPGGTLNLRYTVYRDRSCFTKLQKSVRDHTGQLEIYEDMNVAPALRPIGSDVYISSTIIPKRFKEGPADYRSTRQFQCNFTHWAWPIVPLVADIPFWIEGAPLSEPVEVIPRK